MPPVEHLIAVARGLRPADLAVRGAEVFNVFSGEFATADVLVADGRVAAVLPAGTDKGPKARDEVEAAGLTLTPGFIDAHVHIESSHLCPEEFTALTAAAGVTSVVADPHEVCNVMGLAGLDYMLAATEDAPTTVWLMLPSCVPAGGPEQAAHTLTAGDLATRLDRPRVLGLGEMMNYPGVLGGDPEVMAKLELLRRRNEEKFGPLSGLSLDGHAPLVAGRDLQAYAAAGISSDHEASTVVEARERLGAGMGLMLRQGSSVKNLLDLVPAVTPHTVPLCMLCTDDRHVADLMEQGSINHLVRLLCADGRLSLPEILRMASWNAARHFNLRELGAVAPGMRADFALYADKTAWRPKMVWNAGRLVAENGRCLRPAAKAPAEALRDSVRLAPSFGPRSLEIPDPGKAVKVMGAVPRQIITEKLQARLPGRDGLLQADPARDIAKLAVFERHHGTGNVGLGFVKGMGLRRGAMASTVAHDSHNLIVMGMNDADMLLAARTLREAGGGQAACLDGKVLALLPLPLAGLFGEAPAAEVRAAQHELHAAARGLGTAEGIEPFMTLAFMSLAVIPSLKLTAGGLMDVESFALTPLEADPK